MKMGKDALDTLKHEIIQHLNIICFKDTINNLKYYIKTPNSL